MEIDKIVERPGLLLWEDGVVELALGLFVAGYIVALWQVERLPRDWAGFSGPILLACMAFGIRWLVNLLRRTIVFPRGGYVALQDDGKKRAQTQFWFWLLLAVSGVFWIVPAIPDYPHKNAVGVCLLYAAIWLYSGIRYRQRYQIVLGIFAIPFAQFVLTRHLGITPVVLTFACVSLVAGAIKLRRFIGSHPVLPQIEI